jgi:hypothetical protein
MSWDAYQGCVGWYRVVPSYLYMMDRRSCIPRIGFWVLVPLVCMSTRQIFHSWCGVRVVLSDALVLKEMQAKELKMMHA